MDPGAKGARTSRRFRVSTARSRGSGASNPAAGGPAPERVLSLRLQTPTAHRFRVRGGAFGPLSGVPSRQYTGRPRRLSTWAGTPVAQAAVRAIRRISGPAAKTARRSRAAAADQVVKSAPAAPPGHGAPPAPASSSRWRGP